MTDPPSGPHARAPKDVEPSPIRHRPVVAAALAFGCGIAAAEWLGLDFWSCLLGSVSSLAILLVSRGRAHPSQKYALVLLALAATGAATLAANRGGAGAASPRTLAHVLPPGRTLCWIRGRVEGETVVTRLAPPIQTRRREPRLISRVTVAAREVSANNVTVPVRTDVQVRVGGEMTHVAHGDDVRIFGWLHVLDPADPMNRYALSRGLAARMSLATPGAVRVEREDPGSLLRFLYAIKRSFRRQIDAAFDGDAAIVLKAVLLGDRERLGRRLGESFNRSGTMHVLAISGLHVGIVYLTALWLCRRLLIGGWRRHAILLVAVLAYATTSGFRPATFRATLMIVFLEIGQMLFLRRDPLNAVATAALVILAWSPHQLFEAGFQLTFVAVTGILLFADGFAGALRGEPRDADALAEPEFVSPWRRRWRDVWWTTSGALGACAAATLAVMPLQAFYFHVVTPISVLATFVLLPVVFALIASGFVFLAAASAWAPLGGLVAHVVSGMAWLLLRGVETAAAVPMGHAFVRPPAVGSIVAFYALLVVAASRWRLRLSPRWAAVPPILLVSAHLAWSGLQRPPDELTVTFVDVQHGTCCVITKGRTTVVYDCGSGSPLSTWDVGSGPAARCLWERGAHRIDLLMLSHTDSDHVNGVLGLMDRFPVGRVVANHGFGKADTGRELIAAFERRGISFDECGAGDRVEIGDLAFDLLWPPKSETGWRLGARNDRSLVARLRSVGRTVLLTGDVELPGMVGLMSSGAELRSEVLYVPHHGADEPELPRFLRAVDADVAVISASRRGTSDRVLDLFADRRLYCTFRDGDVTLTATREGWRVRTERSSAVDDSSSRPREGATSLQAGHGCDRGEESTRNEGSRKRR
jgi:competence protein ComEC